MARDRIVADYHGQVAVVQWKTAAAFLEASSNDPVAAEQRIQGAVGYGITQRDADLLTTLVWSTFEQRPEPIIPAPLAHTVAGKPIGPEGSPYGVTHDFDCPGCADIPFTASPRSEAYWAS